MLQPLETDAHEIASLMAGAEIVSELVESAISTVSAYARLYRAPAGTMILKEGAVSPTLCLIVDGSVDIIKELGESVPRTVATLSAGKSLGEMSVLDDLPFSATACATEDTRLIVFEKSDLNQLARDYPQVHNQIIYGLTKEVTERLRRTTDVLASHLSRTDELTGALNIALRAAQSRSSFVADMSHQMRTPLNAIMGYADLLQDDIDAGDLPSAKSDIISIREACEIMARLVTDILDLSKIEAGQVKLRLEEIGIDYLLQNLVIACEPLAKKRNNRIVVLCSEDAGMIKADEIQLRQMLFNLLENAATHTENGEIRLSATAVERDNGQWIEFRVVDNGRGMSPEQVDNIFGRFSGVDSHVRAKYAGTGLGLAISQSLCRMFGGEISVESELGKGTILTVSLPRVPVLQQSLDRN